MGKELPQVYVTSFSSAHVPHLKKNEESPKIELDTSTNEGKENDIDDVVIDKLFYRICYFCMMLGVNFYKVRKPHQKILSGIIVGINVTISIYFMLYVAYTAYRKPINQDTLATTLAIVTWTLQATLSTLFVAYWQSIGASCEVIKEIYRAQKGAGFHHNRRYMIGIVRSFYVVLFLVIMYKISLMFITWNKYTIGFFDPDIVNIFGERRRFIIVQCVNLYTHLCWAVALFVYVLLVHATNYEFVYFNKQVRSLQIRCENKAVSEDELHEKLLAAMKVHNRLIKCVKRLDNMFNRYAFIMIATIIPTTTFGILMLVRKADEDFVTRCIDLIFALPHVAFFIFSFFAITNAPAQLHDSIHATKMALCSNNQIWFPYRPNVYLSATALVCHFDQTNLGVSIWGFSVISKPFVLTALSVMVTCLALFMQL